MTFFSPINDTVHNLTLFRGGLAEINASCLNALMSHKVCEKRNIVATVKKALGEAVAERVRIHHLCVDAVLRRKLFQFARNAPCGDTLSTLIEEDKTAVLLLFCKPRKGFFLQGLRNVDTAELAAFGVQVMIAEPDVFHLDLDQLAHSRSRGSKKADHKEPEQFAVLFQTLFEVQVIRFTDNIFEEWLLLNLDKGQLPLLLAHAFKVAVHSTQAEVYRLRFEVIHQPYLVSREVLLGYAAVLVAELLECEQVGGP